MTVYGPAGVPLLPPPPPPPDEDPPHAFRKSKPENRTQPNRKPRYRLLREVKPAPSRARPPIGNHMANESSEELASDAVVTGLVVTVSTDVPVPPVTVAGAKAHVGANVTTGVMAVQERLTSPVNPFTEAMVIVEVELAPALTEAGVKAEADKVKSTTGAGPTVRATVVV